MNNNLDYESKTLIKKIDNYLDSILENFINKQTDDPERIRRHIISNIRELNYPIDEKVKLAVKAGVLEPEVFVAFNYVFSRYGLESFKPEDLHDILNKMIDLIKPIADKLAKTEISKKII